jgi:gamma-D-glutamyl-L-lysine dipeptidyl-peptidase
MLFVLAMALLAANPLAVVRKPAANMYSAATEQADVVSQAIYGSNVALLEEKGGWARVRTADDYAGWMPETSFWRLPAGQKPYAAEGRVAQVEALFANLYQEPDVTRHQPVLTVPFETRLLILAEPKDNQRWLEVRLVDGGAAWVQRGDVTFETAAVPVPAVIALSKRFLGLPYLWGGTSTFGFDCSGFVQMLCRRRGVLIPRDAQPQAEWSGFAPVERKELQPGDLLYFGKAAGGITHTGMYLGDGQFISATTHNQPVVRIDRLDDPYWSQLLVAARRLK